ncbi:MAG: cupredoxin domain-containing protein [Candidatus Limnocylindria bacterium]
MTDQVRIFDIVGRPESEWGYDPREIRVASGTTVTFTNDGDVFHTVTSDGATRLFDVAANPGESVTLAFDEPGTFSYHCGVHPDMKGVVHVCDGECR